MLECGQCGDVYFTATPELFRQCESCGGNLIDTSPEEKEETQKQNSIVQHKKNQNFFKRLLKRICCYWKKDN
jgi:predicted  nucleic acid-binding Zn-ribbon protein